MKYTFPSESANSKGELKQNFKFHGRQNISVKFYTTKFLLHLFQRSHSPILLQYFDNYFK